jgi:hypothetical protein
LLLLLEGGLSRKTLLVVCSETAETADTAVIIDDGSRATKTVIHPATIDFHAVQEEVRPGFE